MVETGPHHLELINQLLMQRAHFWVHKLLMNCQPDSKDMDLLLHEFLELSYLLSISWVLGDVIFIKEGLLVACDASVDGSVNDAVQAHAQQVDVAVHLLVLILADQGPQLLVLVLNHLDGILQGAHLHQLPPLHFEPPRDAWQAVGQGQRGALDPQALEFILLVLGAFVERPVIPEPPHVVDAVEALDAVRDPVHLQDVHVLWDGRHCIDLQVLGVALQDGVIRVVGVLHGDSLRELAEHPLLEGLQPLVVVAPAHVLFVPKEERKLPAIEADPEELGLQALLLHDVVVIAGLHFPNPAEALIVVEALILTRQLPAQWDPKLPTLAFVEVVDDLAAQPLFPLPLRLGWVVEELPKGPLLPLQQLAVEEQSECSFCGDRL